MSDVNPYAPPSADEDAPARAPRKGRKKRAREDLQAAIDALNEHLSDPANVAADLKASGGRLRRVTMVFLGLGACGTLGGILLWGDRVEVAAVLCLLFGGFLLVLGAVAAALDWQVPSRTEPSSPERTLKGYIRGITLARYGYAWACLCPTAREQSVSAPNLGPVAAGIGAFSMRDEAGVKAYAGTFARVGNGKMRGLQVKNIRLAKLDGDVATVEAQLLFQSWPQWASVLIGMGGAFGWRVGNKAEVGLGMIGVAAAIVGFIAMMAMRKSHNVAVRRTLLRGSNGVWYVFDPDILEGASAEE